jgi:hypothetical protein
VVSLQSCVYWYVQGSSRVQAAPFDSSKVLHMECGSEDPQSDFIKIYGPWIVFGGAYVNRSTVIYAQRTIDMTSNPNSMHLHCPGYSTGEVSSTQNDADLALLVRWPLSHKGSGVFEIRLPLFGSSCGPRMPHTHAGSSDKKMRDKSSIVV